MDFFLAICQALGIGLAVGVLIGAVVPRGDSASLLVWGGAVIGAIAGALSISSDDQSIVAGIVAGAAGGWLGARVISGVVVGAVRRAGGFGSIVLIVVVAALLLAGLSILLPPVSLLAVLALGWLMVARRRRADRKYEGLRILR
jgi:hypothetical protein